MLFNNFKDLTNVNVTVTAFDPGGTTGWCRMTVPSKALLGNLSELPQYVTYQTGEIDCMTIHSVEEADEIMSKHNGINSSAENRGVSKMIELSHGGAPFNAVVLEDFILDFQKADMSRDTLSPVRLVASYMYAIKLTASEGEIVPTVFVQDRGNVKTTATDKRLRSWKLYDTKTGRHARDATRHAIYFLRDRVGASNKAAELRWRAWPSVFDDPYRIKFLEEANKSKPRKPREPGERIFI